MDSALRYRDAISKPAGAVPADGCDCHAHVFGDPHRYPLVANRSYTPHPAPVRDYVRVLDALGLTRAVLTQPSIYGLDNSCLIASLAELGLHRARGVAAVPRDISERELAALDEQGVRGIRFVLAVGGGANADDIEHLAMKIAPFKWHIEVYAPSQAWAALVPRLIALPTDVVIDHMGRVSPDEHVGDAGRDAVMRAVDSGRCWIKLCGYRLSQQDYPYADVFALAAHMLRRAPERCVWGTDWPHPNLKTHMPDDGRLLDLLAAWTENSALLKRVLVDNPAALYRFDAPRESRRETAADAAAVQ
jgi:predicted TIM-barrel fold metal-dependent hydrolase